MKSAPCLVTIVAVLTFTSCQRRAVCKTKTDHKGTGYIRIYEGSFNTLQEYNNAITEYKKAGYTCDDSVTID